MKLAYRTQTIARAISGVYAKPLEPFDWYEIKATSDDSAELFIYDYIGWPFNDAGEVVRSVADMRGKDITVRINSPGGDVFDAMAIYNAFTGHDAKVTTRAEALAASAASIILLAGKEVQAYQNAMLMVHDPWLLVAGNRYDLREAADILDKISGNMVDIYSEQSNVGKKDMREMLKSETWLTAKEAKDKGFINTILDRKGKAKAAFDLSMFENVPDDLVVEGNQAPTIRDAEKALRDAGFSRDKAKAMLAGGWQNADGDFEKDCEIVAQMLNETIQTFGGQLNG
jgi:ATP-dependent Clp protease protease subunit